MAASPWILLTLERDGPIVKVWLRTDEGKRYAPDSAILADGLQIPNNLAAVAAAALERLPALRRTPNASLRVPLAVFLDVPPSEAAVAWEALLLPHLRVSLDRVQFARLSRPRWLPRSPFRLPFRILAVGRRSLGLLDAVRDASWYREPPVHDYGLQIEFADARDLARDVRRRPFDIVLGDGQAAAALIGRPNVLPRRREARPRLLVVTGGTHEQVPLLATPTNFATLEVPSIDPVTSSQFVSEFVYGLIHDFPLHEAVKAASGVFPPSAGSVPVALRADPATNQALRLSDAATGFQDDARRLRAIPRPGLIDDFVVRAVAAASERIDPDSIRRHLRAAEALQAPVTRAIDVADRLGVDFQRELTGLTPLARAEEAMAQAQPAAAAVARELSEITKSSEAVKAIAAIQERRADISLDELDELDVYRPVERFRSLVRGRRHKLYVTVGHRAPTSIMAAPAPPIDPLLPEPPNSKGHLLDIVLFPRDFKARSATVVQTYLPLLGAAEPVTFDIVAPTSGDKVECRVSIYHQNDLIQSFRISSMLSATPDRLSSPKLSAELDFSRTTRYANLDSLGGRVLSLGINDAATGDHSIMLKKDGVAHEIPLTEKVIEGRQLSFRKILERYARVTGGSDDMIRELAEFGGATYALLHTSGGSNELRTELRQVSTLEDQTIQISRIQANFALPWAVLYDYSLPEKITGDPPARVCKGEALPNGPPDDAPSAAAGCIHNPRENVYCIFGFWGVRHRLEQNVNRGRDPVTKVQRPVGVAGICVAIGVDDKPTQALAIDLAKQLAKDVAPLGQTVPLLDVLGDPKQRPAIMAVLGHLQTNDIVGEPFGPRIRLFPPATSASPPTRLPPHYWLGLRRVDDYTKKNRPWADQPLSIVLLAACSVGATEVGTVTSFMTSFDAAGAAAVVAAESTIYSDLASQFVKHLLTEMWKPDVTLGETMQAFNKQCIIAGNPLSFTFSTFGKAELSIA